ncbi:MAG: hypothetical protein K6T75_08000 [Acetobacteraceae bacterium]|nr:hypothetical protein [Acetobacteraceae bacterium]
MGAVVGGHRLGVQVPVQHQPRPAPPGPPNTLEANAAYWKGRPTVDKLIFKPVPEAATRVALLKTGEADIVTNLSPAIAQQLAQEKGIKAKTVPSMLIIYFALDETKPGPLQNALVRQAMNYAVDKEGIIGSILLGCGKLEANPISPETFGYNSSIKPYPYDPARARQLLAEAGYPNGFTVDMVAPVGRYVKDKEVAEAVAAQLGQVGIRVNLQVLEYGVYTGVIRDPAKRPPMWMLGWGGYGTYHGDLTLFPLFRTGELYSASNNAELDAILDRAIVTLDDATHVRLLQQAQEIIHEEALRLFLYQQVSIYGVSDRLDWSPRSDEDMVLWQVTGTGG